MSTKCPAAATSERVAPMRNRYHVIEGQTDQWSVYDALEQKFIVEDVSKMAAECLRDSVDKVWQQHRVERTKQSATEEVVAAPEVLHRYDVCLLNGKNFTAPAICTEAFFDHYKASAYFAAMTLDGRMPLEDRPYKALYKVWLFDGVELKREKIAIKSFLLEEPPTTSPTTKTLTIKGYVAVRKNNATGTLWFFPTEWGLTREGVEQIIPATDADYGTTMPLQGIAPSTISIFWDEQTKGEKPA